MKPAFKALALIVGYWAVMLSIFWWPNTFGVALMWAVGLAVAVGLHVALFYLLKNFFAQESKE